MGIRLKRQGGMNACEDTPRVPKTLKYGEPAVDSAGTLYIGDGSGAVHNVGLQLYTGTLPWADG